MNLTYNEINSGNINEVLPVVRSIFPEDIGDLTGHYKEYINKYESDWKFVRYWKYFCVKDDEGRIVAVTGLYNESDKHDEDEVWLGWFGVMPEYRGRGVGQEVLNWTITKARELGYKKLRLWTTTSLEESEAQNLYEKLGIKIYKRERYLDTDYEKLYREVYL